MNEQQPQNMPIQPVPAEEPSLIHRTFTPKFSIAIAILIIVGGLAYAYSTYLASKNFNEVTRQAQQAEDALRALEQERAND